MLWVAHPFGAPVLVLLESFALASLAKAFEGIW